MLNITNRTPLAGVKLFESSTYPADSIDLYWRDDHPISFELSDNPDDGKMYANFLAHIQSQLLITKIQFFQHDESRLTTAEVRLQGMPCWIVMDYDVITLHRYKPVIPGHYEEKPDEICKYLIDMFSTNVEEAVLAVSFSPVDLAWLFGHLGNRIGFYEETIWKAALQRL